MKTKTRMHFFRHLCHYQLWALCVSFFALCVFSSCSKSEVAGKVSTSDAIASVTTAAAAAALPGQTGYCNVNGSTTGGGAGPTVTVSNLNDFRTYATSSSPYVIRVSGSINLNGRVAIASNKTIQGVNASARITGNIYIANGTTNVIISNLNITNPDGDGITIRNGNHVWVDHCAIFDCSDGLADINNQSDYITVSWCKFYYVNQTAHRFTMILGSVGAEVDGKLHVTLHHNWWGAKCDQRMPSGTQGNAHLYNNYFSCEGNSYASDARAGSFWYSDYNYYQKVNNPLSEQLGGKIRVVGNIYNQCTGKITKGETTTVAPPPYNYAITPAQDVPAVVMNGAGPRATPTF
ncbi:pectate lyase family protein [Chitinophaga rhizophila]|uniref:Pectate lyase domain-containing protein n=1 Tax=Chitinophaga rhizophila TaxID=2866212 RepID=A0ABS7GDE0_9BACT|nr:hypothetical protein [Chitinophaga rhizophila]MBW8684677.1 hypothetical protein [Chitinophaga rhizophila]